MSARNRTAAVGQLDRLLTVKEIADETSMTARWWYERVWSGELAAVKLGRHIRVRRSEVERFMAAHSTSAV